MNILINLNVSHSIYRYNIKMRTSHILAITFFLVIFQIFVLKYFLLCILVWRLNSNKRDDFDYNNKYRNSKFVNRIVLKKCMLCKYKYIFEQMEKDMAKWKRIILKNISINFVNFYINILNSFNLIIR